MENQLLPKRKEVDMHIHSHYSDGDCTIEELIKRIKKAGLTAAVLTDHDKIDGCNEFIELCRKNNINTMTGIEISTSYLDYTYETFLELHILGYGFNIEEMIRKDNGLCFSYNAEQRNLDTLEAIGEMKSKHPNAVCNVTEKDIAKMYFLPRPLISRYWVAKYVAYHLAKKMGQNKFPELVKHLWNIIKYGNTHNMPRRFAHPQEAMELIITSGGIAVWAHPNLTFIKLEEKFGREKALIIFQSITKELKDYGIIGMEAFTSHNKKKEIDFIKNICKEYNLSPYFGGSDYHGDDKNEHKPELYLGKGGISYKKFLNIRK